MIISVCMNFLSLPVSCGHRHDPAGHLPTDYDVKENRQCNRLFLFQVLHRNRQPPSAEFKSSHPISQQSVQFRNLQPITKSRRCPTTKIRLSNLAKTFQSFQLAPATAQRCSSCKKSETTARYTVMPDV